MQHALYNKKYAPIDTRSTTYYYMPMYHKTTKFCYANTNMRAVNEVSDNAFAFILEYMFTIQI